MSELEMLHQEEPMDTKSVETLFCAQNITKSFAGTKALKGVELDIRPGEIVGLVGENGAGKSTLLKIIIGAQPQSSGEMTLRGAPFAPKTPMEANHLGIGMVFQEQSLIVNLNVAQNIFFGHEKEFKKGGIVNWRKMNKAAAEVLAAVDITDIPPTKKVSDLNFATRQMVEIAKVMNVTKQSGEEHCLILLDEPTSVLNEGEVENLYKQMRKIAAQGHSIIFVSHHLNEILEVTDRIFVYKDGTSVGSLATKDATEGKLYEMMVGKSTTSEYYHLNRQTVPTEEVLLEARDLGKHGIFKHVDFKLHKGEVLGLCGVVGSGAEEVCEVLCGDEKPSFGKVYINGQEVNFTSPQQALKKSILMIPKERLFEGIVGTLSVEENIALSNANKLSKNLVVSAKAVRAQANKWIETMKIKTSGPEELVMQLSGGNQQKVVFSRALASEADVLILNHPTRGVDVGAKEEIYDLIRNMTEQGKAVILLGDTLDECIGVSSRLLTMKDGLVTGEFDASADKKPSQVDVVSLMM
jgi:ribose transport system ATP-binding protein